MTKAAYEQLKEDIEREYYIKNLINIENHRQERDKLHCALRLAAKEAGRMYNEPDRRTPEYWINIASREFGYY